MTDDNSDQDDLQDLRKAARSVSDMLAERERKKRENENFRLACAALESALTGTESQEELDDLYDALAQAAERSGNEIDEDLRTRYEQRLDELDTADRKRVRRQTLWVFLISLTALALIGGGVFYWWYRGQVAAVVREANSLIEAGQLDQAQQLLASVKEDRSWLARASAISDVETTLNTHVSSEEERRESFLEMITVAETAGVETPDQSALAKAKELANTEGEMARVRELEAGIIEYMDKQRNAKEEELRTELQSIAEAIEGLEADPRQETVPQEIQKLSTRLRQVDVRAVDFGFSSEVDAPRNRLDGIQDARQQSMKQDASEARITSALGEYDRYVSALQTYASDFPESPLSEDFEVALDERDLWQGMEAWNDLARKCELADLRNLTPEVVASLGKETSETAANHPDFPQQSEFQHLSPFLEAVSRRSAGGEDLAQAVKETFSDPLVFGLLMVQTRDGKRYYVTQEPKKLVTEFRFSYLIDFAQGRRDAKIQIDELVLSPDGSSCSRAPQSLLAESVLRNLNQLNGGSWESVFYKIIYAVATQKDVDPVLRVALLESVLDTGCQGSYPLQLGFAKHLEHVENLGFSTLTNWMDPENSEAGQVRGQAALLLEELPDVEAAGTAAGDYYRRFADTKFTTYRWIGWLKRASRSEWTCEHQPIDSVSGNLVIIRKSSGKPEMLTIGSFKEGQVRLTSATQSFLAGRPVYVQIRPAGS